MSARTTTVNREIAAPPGRVWELLTDASSHSDWNESVISISGPIEVGNTVELVSVVNPERTFKLKVVEMDAPRRMVWADGMPLGLSKGVRTYDLVPSGTGTSFTMTEVFSGLMARLIVKAIPDMTDSFDLFAEGLKSAAEQT